MVKNPSANAEDIRDVGSIPCWEDPLVEGSSLILQPIPVFLSGESHGQRSLGGLQSKESDMTEGT